MAVFTAAAAIGASVLGAIGVGATTAAAFGTGLFIAQAAVGFLVQAALGLALNALTPKPKTQGANRGYQINTRGSALDHQIIYGRMRVGGAIVFESTASTDISSLHQVFVHAGHEVESYDEVYIDNRKVTKWLRVSDSAIVTNVTTNDGEQYAPYEDALIGVDGNPIPGSLRRWYVNATTGVIYATFTFYDGSQTVADPLLKSAFPGIWTDSHQLNGLAYMGVKWVYNADVYPNQVPLATATIKGKKVYDPRTDTTAWSDNPALCIRDYLVSGYGLDESVDNVDDTLVSTAADVCDRTDTILGDTRYTCNGAFVTTQTPYDTLNDLLTSMGGLLWYAQGKWRMKPAYWTEPTISFDENDLRSSVAVKTRHSRRDNFNIVKGTFRGEETQWQVSEFPEVSNPDFIEADNGQESVIDLELPFTDNSNEARRIARIVLERNRQQLTVQASFGLRAFQVQVGDVVNLSVERFGWTNKTFEVTSWTFGLTEGQDLQVQMTLREITENVFDEVSDGAVFERDNTELPTAFLAPPVGISLANSVEVVYEHARNTITATVTGNASLLEQVEVQYKPSSGDTWVPVGFGELGSYRIVDLEDGLYDVRARAISLFGSRGPWATRLNFESRGLIVPPEQVQNFVAEVNGPTINLEWSPVSDPDLSYYKIRYTPETDGSEEWNFGVNYVEKVAKPATSVSVPARSGTFMIKAVDQGGRESIDFTSVVVSASDLESFTTTLTQTEDPTFSGTKTDTEAVSGNLRIGSTTLFDSLVGNIDSLSGDWDDLGTGNLGSGLGSYEFSSVIDIGSVKRARVRVDAYQSRFDTESALFDNLEGDVDSLPVLWDDLTANPDLGDTDVISYVSTTNDDPTGSPTWSDYKKIRVADISARAFRFKVELKSQSNLVTPSISQLDAVVQHN